MLRHGDNPRARVHRDWSSMLEAPVDDVPSPGEYEVNSVVD